MRGSKARELPKSVQAQQHDTASAAARDAMASGDARLARILLAQAPIKASGSEEEIWPARLAEGLARGARFADAIEPLLEKLRQDHEQWPVQSIWCAALEKAWKQEPANGEDPFLALLALWEAERARLLGDGASARPTWSPHLELPQGGLARWSACAASRREWLGESMWQAATRGIEAACAPSRDWVRKEQPQDESRRAEALALAIELADFSAPLLCPAELASELERLSSTRWADEEAHQSVTEPLAQKGLNASRARAFTICCERLEAVGARWDAKLARGGRAPLSAVIRKHGGEIYSPAFERAREQLGSETFWRLHADPLLRDGSVARRMADSTATGRLSSPSLEAARGWRGAILRADSDPPQWAMREALRRTMGASLSPTADIEPKEAIALWKGMIDDMASLSLADVAPWPGDFSENSLKQPSVLPTSAELFLAVKRLAPKQREALAQAIGAFSELGVAIPWRAEHLEQAPETALVHAAIEAAELRAVSARAKTESELAQKKGGGPLRV
jgi:hypothetical protein